MKNNIFVALDLRESSINLPRFINRIYTESFNEKAPMEPIYSSDWLFYNPKKDGIPPSSGLSLPKELIVVCKSVKQFEQDFFVSDIREWIISERFYQLIKTNNFLENTYEESSLNLVSNKGKKISSKEYYLLRFYKGFDEIIDFDVSVKISAPNRPGLPKYYYSELILKAGYDIPEMFFLEEPCFRTSFFVSKRIKEYMEYENFLGFNFYTLEDFAIEKQFRDKNPY